MKLIAAVDSKWGIGRNGRLLFSIPEDMKFFREQTTGKAVVMGYNTLLSLPGSKPLKNRTNIVLSRKPDLCIEGAYVCKSENELFKLIRSGKDNINPDDVMIIGGAAVYSELLPYCKEALITKIAKDGGADRFIPNLDADGDWTIVSESDVKEHSGLQFRFVKYTNSNVKNFLY